jgi:hypothetical protein
MNDWSLDGSSAATALMVRRRSEIDEESLQSMRCAVARTVACG